MINADMRYYDFFTYGAPNSYGQPQLSKEPQGTIKIAINSISNSNTENLRYKDSTFLGLTLAPIDDTYVIQYGAEKLKVLYVVPKGRLKQVYMKNL